MGKKEIVPEEPANPAEQEQEPGEARYWD